jgi:hypothetical protein
MAASENAFKLYPNLGYWLMLFIPLTITGFYFTYLTQIQISPSIIHLHFVLMALWMGIMIVQPLLIRYKKLNLHRTIGKISYFIVPLVILSAWMVMQKGYADQLAGFESDLAQGVAPYTYEVGRIVIASYSGLAFVYVFWLAVFYGLAIGFRKQSSIHARFMIATALTFLGPTLDRTLFFWFDLATVGPGIPSEIVSFVLIDLILIALLIQDIRKNKNPWPFLVALGLYIPVQVFYFTQTKTSGWEQFVNFMLN